MSPLKLTLSVMVLFSFVALRNANAENALVDDAPADKKEAVIKLIWIHNPFGGTCVKVETVGDPADPVVKSGPNCFVCNYPDNPWNVDPSFFETFIDYWDNAIFDHLYVEEIPGNSENFVEWTRTCNADNSLKKLIPSDVRKGIKDLFKKKPE